LLTSVPIARESTRCRSRQATAFTPEKAIVGAVAQKFAQEGFFVVLTTRAAAKPSY
jgi:hypothetical protein